jgi:fructokinase
MSRQAPLIVVAGEALIDLIEQDGALRAFPGGGPFNTAVALGRLGMPVGFLGRLSQDRFGRLLEDRLAESGVDRRYVLRSGAPTALAVVHDTGGGEHEFTFYLERTAYADLVPEELPALEPAVVAVYLGTLALATDPPAAALEALIERESATRLIVIDPNVRPAVFGDPPAYRARFESWAAEAHVLKLSVEDAGWLYPMLATQHVVDRLLELGARLVVLTFGEDGAIARTASGEARSASPPVEVVDTVGAGDAFAAGLLRRLHELGLLDPEAVGRLGEDELADVLRYATVVGALQCARAGAAPPTLDEVERFL